MKSLFHLILLHFLLTPDPAPAQSPGSVSMDFFYEALQPYGHWREVGDYGYCWQPDQITHDWSPYSQGRWLYSDVGWTWDSDEPFGWAVYHYGRWANIASMGWVWVPGSDWSPGWVSWRHNSQYIGWAPLPPEALFQAHIGFSSWVDDYYDIGPDHYRFVENRNFSARRLGNVFIDQSRNSSIIHQTTNITNIRYENQLIHNDGPRYAELSLMSAEPIHRYQLQRRQNLAGNSPRHAPENHRSHVQGDSLSVFAPPIDSRRPSNGPNQRRSKVADAQINRGWDRVGNPATIAALRQQMKGSEPAPKELPPRPRLERERPGGNPTATQPDRPPTSNKPPSAGKPKDRPQTTQPETRPGKAPTTQPAAKTPPTSNKPPSAGKPKDRPQTTRPEARPGKAPTTQPSAKTPPTSKKPPSAGKPKDRPQTTTAKGSKPANRQPESNQK